MFGTIANANMVKNIVVVVNVISTNVVSFVSFSGNLDGFDNVTLMMDCCLGNYSVHSPYCNTSD